MLNGKLNEILILQTFTASIEVRLTTQNTVSKVSPEWIVIIAPSSAK